MAKNIGQLVADAWADVAAQTKPILEISQAEIFTWPRMPAALTPEQQRERDRLEREWEAETAAWREANTMEAQRFLGVVTEVHCEDGSDFVLTYADGRRVRILSGEYRWL